MRRLPAPLVHGTSLCSAHSSHSGESTLSFVFLASQYSRQLLSKLASRRCPCLGVGVIPLYALAHEGEPPPGTYPPLTHPHAGRTQGLQLAPQS